MKEIAKNYNAREFEQKIYKKWEESGYFNPDKLQALKKGYFSISLPPPNATGVLHLGHASMLAYQDTMVRYNRMLGKKTLWLPGTDHAAIATQNVVEKKIAKEENKTKEDLGREEFLNRTKQYVANSQNTIRNQLRRMGSSLDWDRERYTFSDSLSRCVNMVFKKMYDDGLIYRGHRIVNWCPRCHSTLSDDEVEYKTQKSSFYYFKYGPVVIGTARPETKFADKVIVVHPDDKRFKDLIGKKFTVPWIEGDVEATVIADKEADPELGTGAMTITPAHSFVDYELAKKYNLEIKKIIDEDGNLTAAAGKFAGMNAHDAREEIVKAMDKKGLVDHIDEDYEHNLSVCYRCDTPIEPLLSEQWFVNVNKKISGKNKSLKEMSIEAVKHGLHGKQIEIIPKKFTKVYYHWMNNLHDWCISRQIWWGHRIPVWYRNNSELKTQSSKLEKNEVLVPSQITELIVSRHGLTDWNQEGRVQGQTDVPIDEENVDKIKQVADQLQAEGITKIICSPLMRARQTAEIISQELGIDFEIEELITERDYGLFEKKLVKDIKKEYPDYHKDKINYDIPGEGEESYQSMIKRGEEFLQKIDHKYAGQKLLIISHNAFIRSLEMLINGGTIKELSNFKPLFGTFIRYQFPDGIYKLQDWQRDEDTLDTWFSSSLWTFSTLLDQNYFDYNKLEDWIQNSPDLKKFHPTSVMETGYDIIFFWVARMILMTTYILDEVPFDTVYLHGMIRDKQGRKMSKSLGNGIDPIDMIDKFGADALRLAMMVGASPGNDMRLYEEKIEGYRNFVNKLWNISRFILGSAIDIRVIEEKPKAITLSDKWILSELQELIDQTTDDLNNFRFSPAIERLYEFTWSKFADWYIEISKIETGKDEILLYILQQLLKLWHPFAPFVTEVVWQNFDNDLLMINSWPAKRKSLFKLFKKDKGGEFSLVKDVISIIRNAKAANKVDPVKILNCQIIGKEKLMADNKAVVEKLARIKLVPNKADNWLELHVKGINIAIDIDKEEATKMREKKKQELEEYIKRLQDKLNNDKFVKNAPSEVVKQEKAKLEEAQERLNKLTE